MKGICTPIAALLLAGTAWAAEPAGPSTAPVDPAPVAATPTTAPISPAIQAILAAPDPSSAIQAYARGVATEKNDVELEKAYVRHMVDLGAPEMADAQSRDLLKLGMADPLTMGVVAYNDAARGNAPAAVTNLKPALTLQPADPFLLRTAGQIVAWYDGILDRSSLSKDDVAGIESLRSAGTGRDEFAEAYRMATEARRQASSTASTSTTEPYSAESASAPVGPAPTLPPTTYYNYPAYDDGYVASGYRYYYPYYSTYSYWPSSSIIIVRDCDFHRHHHWNHWDHGGVSVHRWGRGDRGRGDWDRGSGWRSDGIITRPNSGWVNRSPSNFVGPLPVDPANGGIVRSGRDGTSTLRRSSTPRYDSPQPVAGPQRESSVRQRSSSDRQSSADRPAQARPSAAPKPKYDSPQPPSSPPRSSSVGSKSSGGDRGSGGSSKGGGGSSSSGGSGRR
jgi:uncharacterized membrane protein YgcG